MRLLITAVVLASFAVSAATADPISKKRGNNGRVSGSANIEVDPEISSFGEIKPFIKVAAVDVASLMEAAQRGNVAAYAGVANLYERGDGVVRSFDEAFKWYKLGAEQGDARAQLGLAFMYLKGTGAPFDKTQAYKWMSLSAARGTGEIARTARQNLDVLSRSQIAQFDSAPIASREQIQAGQLLAAAWRPSSDQKVDVSSAQ